MERVQEPPIYFYGCREVSRTPAIPHSQLCGFGASLQTTQLVDLKEAVMRKARVSPSRGYLSELSWEPVVSEGFLTLRSLLSCGAAASHLGCKVST